MLAAFSLLSLLGCTDKGGGADDSGDAPDPLASLDVVLVSPVDGAWYLHGLPITAEVRVEDPEGGAVEGLLLSWTGSAVTGAAPPTATGADGSAAFELDTALEVGLHSLGVQVRSEAGATGLASVAFELVDPDLDGDGFENEDYGGDDCDDENPTIHPGAEEFCDTRDNDCNGIVDGPDAVDIQTWYEDLDADGWGKDHVFEIDCDQPKDFVLAPGDCNDDDDAIHPGAAEVCDEVDNDCDDLTDDADDSLTTASASVWYPDLDLDGYGAYAEWILACAAPEDWVEQGGDCADDDDTINPAALETCNGRDDNCIGGIDEDAVDAPLWYLDLDHDGYGQDEATVPGCDQPDGSAAEAGDCDDDDEAVNPAAVEVCNDDADTNCDGDWQGCEGDLLAADGVVSGESSLDEAGYGLSLLGDVDGDGWPDLGIGARSRDGDATDQGAAYVLRGPVTGALDLADAWARFDGVGDSGRAGRALGGGVDATGDGLPDLLVAAPNLAEGGAGTGGVYLVSGEDLASAGARSLDDAHRRWLGEENYGYLGVGVQLVDLDGDALGDAAMGASSLDVGGTNAGAVYLFTGPIGSGITDLAGGGWSARILGETAGDELGEDLDFSGDFDGDGLRDLAFGSGKSSAAFASAGAVYLLSGMPSGELDLGDADARITGVAEGDVLGSFVAAAGDHDGDGYDELLVGAAQNDEVELSAGAAWLLPGRADLGLLAGAVDTAPLATLLGEATGHQLGTDGAGNGDHDGDGTLDLLLGAPYAGVAGSGTAVLFLGPVRGTLTAEDADARWSGDATAEGVGQLLRFGGDLAGTGVDALVIGARSADLAGTDAGAVLIVGSTGL